MSAPCAAIYALAAGAADAGSFAGAVGAAFVFATVVVTGAVVVGGSAVLGLLRCWCCSSSRKPASEAGEAITTQARARELRASV